MGEGTRRLLQLALALREGEIDSHDVLLRRQTVGPPATPEVSEVTRVIGVEIPADPLGRPCTMSASARSAQGEGLHREPVR
ncbi:hypothetical protein KR76_00159 [Pimelobacter simplex]|uniref:Uncharacterized protein n=1 Tax=Nocardioides simplex TaxID=2045 RepID=A0A0C5XI54_NOCSI|nr:hypothetical protein KR76_00159 [Pimelobacter simplex]